MKTMFNRNTLSRKFIFIGILLLCTLLNGTIFAQAEKSKTVSINLKVVDGTGNPVPKAQVFIGIGNSKVETSENGTISFEALQDENVTIISTGYEKRILSVKDLVLNGTVELKRPPLFMTSDDDIALPFLTMKRRQISGSSGTLSGDQLVKYPSTDLRNSLVGLLPGLNILEKNGAPGLSAEEPLGSYGVTQKVSVTSRGKNLRYIIDGVPIDVTEMPLDPEEIGTLTVVNDIVGKAMFGTWGADGLIIIQTKRGKINQPVSKVNIESGVSIVDRMPGWVDGAGYARLNNLARQNSGLPTKYTDDAIAAYSKNDYYDKYYPSINYKGMMLKNIKSFDRINVSSSGGNDQLNYSVYLGYDREGDIYKTGSVADYNRINARSNLDFNINKNLKVRFDIFGSLTIRRSPNYGYATSESSSFMNILEMDAVLADINTIPPVAFPVYAGFDPKTQIPWYGINNSYQYNPVANLTANGFYSEIGRNFSSNAAIIYNFTGFLKGMKSSTSIGIIPYGLVRIGKAKDYLAYIASPGKTTGGADTILLSKVRSGVVNDALGKLHDYYSNRFLVSENLSYEKSYGSSSIQTSLTSYIYKLTLDGYTQPNRLVNIVWTGVYNYKNKYSVQGVLNYSGTSSLEVGRRFEVFPSIGANWIISDEGFMSGIKAINYLKLRAEYGLLGKENYLSPFNYRDNFSSNTSGATFGAYSSNQWFGSNTDASVYRTSLARLGNPNLSWEKRKEFEAGIDALVLNQKLSVMLTYFNSINDGVIQSATNVPYLSGVSSTLPLANNAKIRYSGFEAGIMFTDNDGTIKYSIGGNASTINSEYLKYFEPSYRYGYQSVIGKPVDAFWGKTYLGKFTTDAEALVKPQLYDAVLHAGDLKYLDRNNDGYVDDNDNEMIGHTTPRLFYALNALIKYKNIELTIVGNGAAFYDIPLTNRYFWNGWGDNTYSKFVENNIMGAYPELTYYKINNNFINSDFWLTKGGFFKVKNVELAYNFDITKLRISGVKGIRMYIRGANLLTLSKVKDVDPESIDSGVSVYPLFRTFSGGIKLTF